VLARGRQRIPEMLFPAAGSILLALAFTADSPTRLLALPSVAILSAAFLAELAERVRRADLRGLAPAVAALAAAALVVNLAAPAISRAAPSAANDERLLGTVYEAQGRGSLALSQYDKAKRMAPSNALCRLSLAAMLASDGVAADAEKEFLIAAALDSLSPAPHLGLANLYRRNGMSERALVSLRQALRRAPYDVGLLVSLGRNCVDMGLYEQAEAYFRRVLELDPENVSAIDGLLELRDRGVILKVDRGESRGGRDVKSKIESAMALLRRGYMDSSRAVLDEALEMAPDDLNVVFADATWRLAAGQPEKAIAGYEKCFEENPKNTIVMNNLAAAYQQVGRTEEAMELWRRILKVDPANAKARANLERAEQREP